MKAAARVVLVIMDGWGIAKPGRGNAISRAGTPNYNFYKKNFPFTKLKASGEAVGIVKGRQGNSEVGHLHIGAGRIVPQPLVRINNAIKDGSFFKNKVLLKAMENCRRKKSSLHLMGLCSDEGVHGTVGHLFALMELAKNEKVHSLYIHCFLDGRDVPEKSAAKYIKQIERRAGQLGIGRIASVAGRYYAMDRDSNWGRTRCAYELLTEGKGRKAGSAPEAIEMAYREGDKTDYYVKPTAIVDAAGKPVAVIRDNDSVINFNFRTDRQRQLMKAFDFRDFPGFRRRLLPKAFFVCFTEYYDSLGLAVAFPTIKIRKNLGEVLSRQGLKQLRLAETEKYAHTTYFFNSEVERPFRGERRVMIASSKVPSYDLKPEMSAYKIAARAEKEIRSRKYDFVAINFANCDLVGHSAVMPAIISCCGVVDKCVGVVVEAAKRAGYTALITADHGSAEEKLYSSGEPKPAHSSNPVPLIIIPPMQKGRKMKLRGGGGLSDVAPTILELMGIRKPKEMTGRSLIAKSKDIK